MIIYTVDDIAAAVCTVWYRFVVFVYCLLNVAGFASAVFSPCWFLVIILALSSHTIASNALKCTCAYEGGAHELCTDSHQLYLSRWVEHLAGRCHRSLLTRCDGCFDSRVGSARRNGQTRVKVTVITPIMIAAILSRNLPPHPLHPPAL